MQTLRIAARHGFAARWRRGLIATLAGVLLAAAGAPARAQALAEHDLKAQIVARTLLFVKWPPDVLSEGEPLVLCVPEPHPLGDALLRATGQTINRHRLEVRRSAADRLRGCHIALAVNERAAWLRDGVRGLLRLGDLSGGLDTGVIVNLQVEQGRVVFDVHLKAARDADLEIDPRLLRLARFVKRD